MGNRLQFCRGDSDITGDIYAEDDADEVRIWSDDNSGDSGVVVAVSASAEGKWSFAASDFGVLSSWPLDHEFDSWREALAAFGF